jgi:hypothetical protein
MGKPADLELQVLTDCVKNLSRLDGDAQTRVMEYLSQRFFEAPDFAEAKAVLTDKILRAAADSPATDRGGRFKVIEMLPKTDGAA